VPRFATLNVSVPDGAWVADTSHRSSAATTDSFPGAEPAPVDALGEFWVQAVSPTSRPTVARA
jgi:hypothetical protein